MRLARCIACEWASTAQPRPAFEHPRVGKKPVDACSCVSTAPNGSAQGNAPLSDARTTNPGERLPFHPATASLIGGRPDQWRTSRLYTEEEAAAGACAIQPRRKASFHSPKCTADGRTGETAHLPPCFLSTAITCLIEGPLMNYEGRTNRRIGENK